MQKRLGSPIKRERKDYPQLNYIDKRGVQHIEVNRGCKRQCEFCYSDPNYKTFDIPEIKSNFVQIVGEGFLYDPDIAAKIEEMGRAKFNNKVVYYGISQGIDFRLLTPDMALLLSKNRFGVINNKGKWYKGMRFAWDLGMEFENLAKATVIMLEMAGYKRDKMMVFVLTNWKIPYDVCVQKLEKLKEWGIKIDDCTWDTTKRVLMPMHWTKEELKDFRRQARKHNQIINFRGYDPELLRNVGK